MGVQSRFISNGVYSTILCICFIGSIESIFLMGIVWQEQQRIAFLGGNRLPLGIIATIGYWLLCWSLAVWRRSGSGRFTRGERILWAKAYTAFWVAELVTLGSFLLVYLWCSWGPITSGCHQFLAARRGLILEFIIYSYLIWLIYILRLALHWGYIQIQAVIVSLCICSTGYLLWRDYLTLGGRDSIYSGWQDTRLGAILATLSQEWIIGHLYGRRSTATLYASLAYGGRTGLQPLINFSALTEFEGGMWIGGNHLLGGSKLEQSYLGRGGFLAKRLALWQFLVFLKMWHQLLILVWWCLSLCRITQQGNHSYTLLAVNSFNVYCCFMIGILLYGINYIGDWEILFRGSLWSIYGGRWWVWVSAI